MQGSAWVALLQRVPPEQSENLLVMTSNGTGIVIKGIVRAEKEYMVVRGRLAGTTEEGGGFFFVPYDQIIYLGFQKLIKDTVIHAMYEGEPAASLGAPAKVRKKPNPVPSKGKRRPRSPRLPPPPRNWNRPNPPVLEKPLFWSGCARAEPLLRIPNLENRSEVVR